MSLRRKKESVLDEDALNITPLIDCVFLLLIFFMVTTVFKNPAALQLTLPIADNPVSLDKRQLVCELDEEGNIALNSTAISIDSFDAYLLNEKKSLGIETLLIKADEEAKHGDVIKLMVIARSVDITQIAMAVDTGKE
jgi:biopolymer transport protein ExbD